MPEPKQWNLRSRTRDGLKISDYPDLTPSEARAAIVEELKHKVACISGENVDDNLIGRFVNDYEKTAARGAVDGITWAYVNVDGTENTYPIRKNDKLCLDMTTGKYLTGVNPTWGPNEHVDVAIALDDFAGPGVERITVKLIVPPTEAPLGETLQVFLLYACPPYKNHANSGMNYWRYFAVPAWVLQGEQETDFTFRVWIGNSQVWVINPTRYPVCGTCMVSKHPSIQNLYVIIDSTQYPAFHCTWHNPISQSVFVPVNQYRIIRGFTELGYHQSNHQLIGHNQFDFAYRLIGNNPSGIGDDAFIRMGGQYEITYGASVTYYGHLFTGVRTSRALKYLIPSGSTNQLMTKTDAAARNEDDGDDDFASHEHGMDHDHIVPVPATMHAKICLVTKIWDPEAMADHLVTDSFYIPVTGSMGSTTTIPGLTTPVNSGERTINILWQPKHGFGIGAGAAPHWMRVCVAVKCEYILSSGPFINPLDPFNSQSLIAPQIIPLTGWVTIRPSGYDRENDSQFDAYGTNEFPIEFPAVNPGTYRWWGDYPETQPPNIGPTGL